MTEKSVIEVKGLSKGYPIYSKPTHILKELVFGGVRHDTFWALRDVSFSVKEGQRVGIIGPNGAGKSTLLRIIAGNLKASSGSLIVNGNVSALLSLVPAWNLEQTGVENIRFNLLLRGCQAKEIATLTDEIKAFAELGNFIDQPVKTYSAGMSARLSFAIATSVIPEILIVDEVLGAGDGYFAGKAAQRMQEFCQRGKCLLFVSHSPAAVQQMCDTVIWMENGSIRLYGEAGYVLNQYELDYRASEDEQTRAHHKEQATERKSIATPEELSDSNFLHFRVTPRETNSFTETHYVRSIVVRGIGERAISVPLEIVEEDSDKAEAWLQLAGCEWGRLHERSGQTTRILSRSTGKKYGGEFLVKIMDSNRKSYELEICLQSESLNEKLSVELLDMNEGIWKPLTCSREQTTNLEDSLVFEGSATIPDSVALSEVKQKVAKENKPSAEILEVLLLAENEQKAIIAENCPFEITVRVKFNKQVKLADVGIKITRSDGVYVFWQSSGLAGKNLENPVGEYLVRFKFDKNILGAGEYSVNTHVSNGWDFPNNYPYSQVFARAVGTLAFNVTGEKDLDFGVLNIRVPVVVE